jgi:hypothetical protein
MPPFWVDLPRILPLLPRYVPILFRQKIKGGFPGDARHGPRPVTSVVCSWTLISSCAKKALSGGNGTSSFQGGVRNPSTNAASHLFDGKRRSNGRRSKPERHRRRHVRRFRVRVAGSKRRLPGTRVSVGKARWRLLSALGRESSGDRRGSGKLILLPTRATTRTLVWSAGRWRRTDLGTGGSKG